MQCPNSKILRLFFIFALAVSAVHAKADSSSAQLKKCLNKSEGVTAVIMACLDAESVALDKELNANYKTLMASLSTGQKKALIKAQRAWLAFRDANCAFYYDPDGGSMARVDAAQCAVDALASRTAELKALVNTGN